MTSDESTESVLWPDCASPVGQDAQIERRVAELLSQMTLEQKIGQMIQAEIAAVTPAQAAEHQLGSVLNGGGSFPNGDKHASVADWLALADGYHLATCEKGPGRLGIPVIARTDPESRHCGAGPLRRQPDRDQAGVPFSERCRYLWLAEGFRSGGLAVRVSFVTDVGEVTFGAVPRRGRGVLPAGGFRPTGLQGVRRHRSYR